MVDWYKYLGVEIAEYCYCDTTYRRTVGKAIGEGVAHAGKMGAILTQSHLEPRIKRCIPMKVIVPEPEHAGELWEGNANFAKQLKTVVVTAAKNVPRRSRTTRSTASAAELGMHLPYDKQIHEKVEATVWSKEYSNIEVARHSWQE